MARQIELEFGEYGRRALDFLESAKTLLSVEIKLEKKPEQVAYCIRESLHSLIDSQVIEGPKWDQHSRRVVKAHEALKSARDSGINTEPTEIELSNEIDAMAEFHKQDNLNQRRLIAVLTERTGTPPSKEGLEIVVAFSKLLTRMSGSLHKTLTIEEACEGRNEAIRLLELLFMPRDLRNPRLESLAALKSPTESDVAELRQLIIHPGYLSKFFAMLTGAQWLPLMEAAGILDPPNIQGWWVGHALVKAMKDQYPAEVLDVLEKLFEKVRKQVFGVYALAWAASEMGLAGRPLLVRCLSAFPNQVAFIAINGISKGEVTDGYVADVADVVLRHGVLKNETYPDPLLEALADGITADNFQRRIELVATKIRELPADPNPWFYLEYEHGVSVADELQFRRSEDSNQLVHLLTQELQQSFSFASSDELLAFLTDLPVLVIGRIVPWLLATHPSTSNQQIADQLKSGLLSKTPTVDDLALVDRAVEQVDAAHLNNAIRGGAGDAPDVDEATKLVDADQIPREWIRLYRWSAALPAAGLEKWQPILELLRKKYGEPSRKAIEEKAFGEFTSVANSFSVDDFKAMSPQELLTYVREWRPTPSEWRSSASDLSSSAMAAMKDDLQYWTKDPISIATQLKHPTYVRSYIELLTNEREQSAASINTLLELVFLVFTEPWPAAPIGDVDRYNYDASWEWAQSAALRLIDQLARDDAHFGDGTDALVKLLADLTFKPVGEYEPKENDAYTRAINHDQSVAFSTLLGVALNDFRVNKSIREGILSVFTKAMTVDGPTGEELRSVLAIHLPQLNTCAPAWLEEHLSDIFDGPLGRSAMDSALKWGSLSSALMETYVENVWTAVGRGIEHSIEKVMLALMNGFKGYEPSTVVNRLAGRKLLSEAGEAAGRILNNSGDLEEPVIERVLKFWRLANESTQNESLKGFGWFALADQIPDEAFTSLLLDTLKRMHEGLEFSYQVATRLAKIKPDETVLTCWDYLVRLRSEAFDQQNVVAGAVDALASTPEQMKADTSYLRLRSTLQERDLL